MIGGGGGGCSCSSCVYVEEVYKCSYTKQPNTISVAVVLFMGVEISAVR